MMWHVVFAERDGRVASPPRGRGIPRFTSHANYSTNPLMFEGFLNRTAGLSSGLSSTNISTEGAFRACGGVSLPSEQSQQSRSECKPRRP